VVSDELLRLFTDLFESTQRLFGALLPPPLPFLVKARKLVFPQEIHAGPLAILRVPTDFFPSGR
jgi:tRNA A37 threonylcarbamoyladenosine synthetase subunit TsaC/SUA5/YrdC